MNTPTNISNLHGRINYKGTVEAWVRYTVNDWKKEIVKKKIGRSGQLVQSFRTQIFFGKDAELIEATFRFKFYGRFVDMGVGKGTKIGDVAENKITRSLQGRKAAPRRAKKWYSSKLFYNVNRLQELMTEKFALAGKDLVISETLNLNS